MQPLWVYSLPCHLPFGGPGGNISNELFASLTGLEGLQHRRSYSPEAAEDDMSQAFLMQPPALEPAAGSPFKVLSNYHSSQQEWSNIFKWTEGSFHKNFVGKEPN